MTSIFGNDIIGRSIFWNEVRARKEVSATTGNVYCIRQKNKERKHERDV